MLITGGESEHDGEAKFGVIIGLQEFQAPYSHYLDLMVVSQ